MLLTVVSRVESVAQFFTVLIIFIAVLGLTWLTTRYIAGFQKGSMKGSNIEIVDSFRLSQNKVIEIVRIADKFVAIAVCKDTVTVLAQLSEDAIVQKDSLEPGKQVQFDLFLKKAKKLLEKADTGTAEKNEKEQP